MNTTRTGMRTILATAAAGALIMGSAAGAMAAPTKGKPSTPEYVKIQTVDIHRHSPINIDSLETARNLDLRVVVRETKKDVTVAKVTVKLEQFASKHEKVATPPLTLTADLINPKVTKKGSESRFKGYVAETALVALGTSNPPALADGAEALMCISTVELWDAEGALIAVDKYSTQSTRRLGRGDKKPVRQCVKLVNPPVAIG